MTSVVEEPSGALAAPVATGAAASDAGAAAGCAGLVLVSLR